MSVHPYTHPVASDQGRGKARGLNMVAALLFKAGLPSSFFTKPRTKARAKKLREAIGVACSDSEAGPGLREMIRSEAERRGWTKGER